MSVRRCRVCGCTEIKACFGGCWWVEPDLCSKCQGSRSLSVVFAWPDAIDRVRRGTKTQARVLLPLPDDATQVSYWSPPNGRPTPGWANPGINYWTRRGNHISPCRYGHRGDYLTIAPDLIMQIAALRVERLQAISDSDCWAEGVCPSIDGTGLDWRHDESGARRTFRQLWQSINGPEAWDADPWVLVISFQRIRIRRIYG